MSNWSIMAGLMFWVFVCSLVFVFLMSGSDDHTEDDF